MTYKVFQWSASSVGKHAARVALTRESLELVGMHVFTETKAGKDVGTLINRDDTGIIATNDIELIKSSDADVVIHTPLPSMIAGEKEDQDLDDFVELLSAGKNVITLVGYMYPKVHGDAVVKRLEDACRKGNSSFHSTGLNPGWMGEILPLTISSLCERIDHLHVLELTNFDPYPSQQVIFEMMGFGAKPDEFASKVAKQKNWLDGLFSESVQMVADGLTMGVTEITSTLETELAEKDFKIAAGVVKQGTVAGQHWRWSGKANGVEVVAHETVWRAHPEVAPHWENGKNAIRFTGRPTINFELERDFTFMNNGMLATAMHAVNAIPHVVDAPPGIQTLLDLPWIFAQK